MSERLHYFNEATTPVMFDCSDSDIDSDVDDSRLPLSPSDRAKQHALQLQLWSDEARRRRRCTLPSSRGASGDRQQSNLSSDRNRRSSPPSVSTPVGVAVAPSTVNSQSAGATAAAAAKRVGRSHSAKNLRIRVTPSSSSRSLLSDVSELALPPSLAASVSSITPRLSNPASTTVVSSSMPLSSSPNIANVGANPVAVRRPSSASSPKLGSGNSGPCSSSRLMMTPISVHQQACSSPSVQGTLHSTGLSSPVSEVSSPVMNGVVSLSPLKTDATVASAEADVTGSSVMPSVAFDSPAKQSEGSCSASRHSNNPLALLRNRRPLSMGHDSNKVTNGPASGTTSPTPRRRHSLSRTARRLTLSRLFGR